MMIIMIQASRKVLINDDLMMMMDDDDNDADDHDIIYVIHVTYIKAWAAGVGAASLKVLIILLYT